MHAGRDLQMVNREMVFGVDHFTLLVREQRATLQLRVAAGEPQRRIHNVEIIIQQREAQIVRPDAIRAVLIHPQRGKRARLCLELLVKGREAAVEADHQRQFLRAASSIRRSASGTFSASGLSTQT